MKRAGFSAIRGRIAWPVIILAIAAWFTPLAGAQSPKLQRGDLIHVNVVGEEITGPYKISDDGTIQVPYLPDPIAAAGRSEKELQEVLLGILKPDYLIDPQVIVTTMNRRKHHCQVLGQVAVPQSIEFEPGEGLTLLQAIGQSGDMTALADPAKVEIVRKGVDAPIAAPMPASRNLKLVDGDTVNVPALGALGTYRVTGYAARPGVYEIPRGRRLSIALAIEHAGGASEAGTLRTVEVIRGAQRIELSGDRELSSTMLQDGDLIKIGRRIL